MFLRGFGKLRGPGLDLAQAATLGALLAVSGILVHSFVDFNLQIPANAAMFYVMAAIVAASFPTPSRRRRDDQAGLRRNIEPPLTTIGQKIKPAVTPPTTSRLRTSHSPWSACGGGGDKKALARSTRASVGLVNGRRVDVRRKLKTRLAQSFYQTDLNSPSPKDVPRDKKPNQQVGRTPHDPTSIRFWRAGTGSGEIFHRLFSARNYSSPPLMCSPR